MTEWPCKEQSQVETGKQKSLEELVEFYAELAEATALPACRRVEVALRLKPSTVKPKVRTAGSRPW